MDVFSRLRELGREVETTFKTEAARLNPDAIESVDPLLRRQVQTTTNCLEIRLVAGSEDDAEDI